MQISDFMLMLKEHNHSLKAFAYQFTKDSNDADDLYQDTVLKAIRYLEKFTDGTNLRAWLFTIMKNTFINDYRKENRIGSLIVKCEDFSSAHLSRHATNNKIEVKFVINDIHKALNLVPNDYAICFIKFFEGYKYHEIADELDIPIGTVKTRIHLARELLKKHLKVYNTTLKAS